MLHVRPIQIQRFQILKRILLVNILLCLRAFNSPKIASVGQYLFGKWISNPDSVKMIPASTVFHWLVILHLQSRWLQEAPQRGGTGDRRNPYRPVRDGMIIARHYVPGNIRKP